MLDICAEDVATADAAKKCQEIAGPSYAVRQSLQTDKRAVKSIYPCQSSALPAVDTTGLRRTGAVKVRVPGRRAEYTVRRWDELE